eukprot:CAMPEP_0171914338 /NCGR_PEP_ID=MMETSP0993-20121228/12698_1 /TAXON_ID=483369 /ORGANISM="non described non described, Strain CCMP2098" /LENGTH=32 /DNA_ID= /DNA_START= /DNA_END= /DNA_ORIENTATION=
MSLVFTPPISAGNSGWLAASSSDKPAALCFSP